VPLQYLARRIETFTPKVKKGETSGWKLEINDSSKECLSSLEGISKKLGPHGRKYLAKRVETSNPEVKITHIKIIVHTPIPVL